VGVLNTLLSLVDCSPTRKLMGQSALSVELAANRCDEQAELLRGASTLRPDTVRPGMAVVGGISASDHSKFDTVAKWVSRIV
jgi:hypothetical protein